MSPTKLSNDGYVDSSYHHHEHHQHHHHNQHSPEPDFVNHELSVNLDSTNAFEGPEKLLEIWFYPDSDSMPENIPEGGLRVIPVSEIEQLLDLVNCKILSKVSSHMFDAYLLSESSLFVYPHKLILKTCGTTTTLYCLSKLLELAIKYCNYPFTSFENIHRIFYSRRSFMFPRMQKEIHQSWSNELEWLNKYFPTSSSKAYVVGDLSQDHWYLYLNGIDKNMPLPCNYPLSPARSNNTSRSGSVSSFSSSSSIMSPPDQTFEMLMTELDPVAAAQFQLSKHQSEFPDMDPENEDYGHLLGQKMMVETGMDSVIPKLRSNGVKVKHDAFAFTPCGFSSNSIIDEDYYCTCHITPENGWSYASFETNLPDCERLKMMNNVAEVLKPGKFCVVYCEEWNNEEIKEAQGSKCYRNLKEFGVDGYEKVDQIVYDLRFGYKLLYSFYQRCC
ncbi:unnamed protein product [Ambrosiozyma monospora]|uniref:Unnamed protein product n=1 Tax=Ambrosiozyma monospora TaxID=43982 RepID=A0ACB5SS50_AMBMO|nr:unnamed protein product [Ambrosiozyma monospora]